MQAFIVLWFSWVKKMGCLGVVLLMAMESSIFPVPSEIVVPPAAFLVAEGKMTLWGGNSWHIGFWGVVLAGTLGSYLGSAITYWISRWLGRAVVVRWGKYFFVSEQKLAMAEHWMHRYEAGGIFFARLLPVIRHLISIPAGIVRMGFGMFSLMTVIGSFIWCVVLAWLGAQAQRVQPGLINDPQGLITFIKNQSHLIVGGILVLAALYFLVLKLTAKPEKPAPCPEPAE